jgi:hypothetical protein
MANLYFTNFQLTIAHLVDRHTRTRCVVLDENAQQQGREREAGADTALITGFSAEVIHAAIDQVLMSISNSTESQEKIRDD